MIICCGKTALWCVLDVVTRCRFRWVCDRHDRAIIGALYDE